MSGIITTSFEVIVLPLFTSSSYCLFKPFFSYLFLWFFFFFQVLLLIDASFGFEMEIFEFLNVCQVHGFPKIMGILTHLDLLKNNKALKKTKKKLKMRFWTEVYQVHWTLQCDWFMKYNTLAISRLLWTSLIFEVRLQAKLFVIIWNLVLFAVDEN